MIMSNDKDRLSSVLEGNNILANSVLGKSLYRVTV